MSFAHVGGHRIEYDRIETAASNRPTLVLLHEGLGSVAMWRDFPGRLAHATGCNALVYSRYGYGNSDPLTTPRPVRYMHDEALIALPELLDSLAIERPILVGHSDGGSIALIHAGSRIRPVAAVVTLAAHVLVEDISVASIAAAKMAFETTDLRAKLARYHADVDSAFWGWNRIWLDPEFRAWNIEACLPGIACPVLAIQGEDDEYGTMEQMRRIGAQVRDVELVELEDCRHSPHKDQPEAVLDVITRFVDRVSS
ncbi:MAG TPA: alpha/beta hydrolase [Gemmatimonadaceae bacterium]|nr:alpha/beta hydrolase [Gemmatimonadaceae bacterium]